MSDLFHLPTRIAVLIVIVFCVSLFSVEACLYAETYTVPQTTQGTLAWDANDPAPDGYYIYQRTEGQAYDYSQSAAATSNTSTTVYNLEYDTTYYFVVRAYLGTEVSGDSNEVSFLAPSSSAASYTISVSASGDGSISPTGMVEVAEGADQTFTISPNTNSYVVNVLVDGVSVGAVTSYTFTQVASNHTISAEFAYPPHTISASAGMGGSISPTGSVSVNHGSIQTFAIGPDSGYLISDVQVDGVSVGPVSSYTFDQLAADHSIHATFTANTVTITTSAGINGAISPTGGVDVTVGSSQTFAISPNSGYLILDVQVDGVSIGAADTYTFFNVTTDHSINAIFSADNQPPSADAGPDQTIEEGQTATLSGLNSIDPDDGIASFQWRQIHGDPVLLNSSTEPETTFTTPNVDSKGTALVFELTVTDNAGATSTDSCIVNVTWVNTPPVADTGVDQSVEEGSQVVLDASNSTDADDGISSYGWKQVNGPTVTLSGSNSATPSFVAPDVGTSGASLTFEATVTDFGGLQDTATCLVNVTWVNTPPVADAGPDQNATIGYEVLLDGSNSHDMDDTFIKSFRWSQTNGAPVELSDATAQRPTFIVPAGAEKSEPITFDLTVTDSGGLQGKDSCQIGAQSSIGPTLHVSMITMESKKKGPNYEANAYVTVMDNVGNIVKEANVAGQWSYNDNLINISTETTRGDGTARLYSDKISAQSGGVFALIITGVTKDGYSYDPTTNKVAQEAQIVP